MSSEHVPPDSDRLNGWKEIAGFLGKGVRTVQRCERDYNLPVHRLGREGGEIIFAFRSELDRWSVEFRTKATGEDAPLRQADNAVTAPPPDTAGSARLSRLQFAAGAVLILVAAALLIWRASTASPPPNPTHWRVGAGELRVSGNGESHLWTHRISYALSLGSYAPTDRFPGTAAVLIDDIDRDGQNEVIFASKPSRREDAAGVSVFNSDGSARFSHNIVEEVRFGSETYSGPWLPYRLFTLPTPDGRHSIWAVYTHALLFPTVVVELSPDGAVLSKYWSNGYVETVNVTEWQGRRVVLLGGTNNESRGASLAVFPYGEVHGSAPAAVERYRCDTCEAGAPAEFFVFPRRCMGRALDGQAAVWETWVDKRGILKVAVQEGPGAQIAEGATAWYSFESPSRLAQVEIASGAKRLHRELEAKGHLDHSFNERDVQDVFPARRWGRNEFSSLTEAKVIH